MHKTACSLYNLAVVAALPPPEDAKVPAYLKIFARVDPEDSG